MFEWIKKFVSEGSGLKPTFESFTKMMMDGRHMFDLASSALLGGTTPEVIRQDLFETDRKINLAEQNLRRQILVHSSVHGATEFPTCLVLMSIAKDAERIGDYCKNLFDLAVQHPFSTENEVGSELVQAKNKVSQLLGHLVSVYASQDATEAKAFLRECDGVEDICDKRVSALVDNPSSAGTDAVAAALAYRHLKRITAHAMNIVTSIVMPVDKLDFFDER